MTKRVCLEPGCPTLTDHSRCERHTRERDRARGTSTARGYNAAYKAERKGYLAQMAAGVVLTCWRCERMISPRDFSLGHCDDDRSVMHGPEHLLCNIAHTRGGCTHPSHGGGSHAPECSPL